MILGLVAGCWTLLATAGKGLERFPPPQFETDYTRPELHLQWPRPIAWEYIDLLVLVSALSIGSWLVHRRRRRTEIFALMAFCLAYLGFFRKGCVCPVGAIQNVALALSDQTYAIPLSVVMIFILPLILALFFGRVFCGSICPLGAVQDLVVLRPLSIPGWLESTLGIIAYLYLGLALVTTAISGSFLVCRYDPFVWAFRLSGSAQILILSGSLLIIGVFVARPYCRFLCPYGVLLKHLSRLSRLSVTVTPDQCIECGLCERACPFGAIHGPKPAASQAQRHQTKTRFLIWLGLTLLLVGLGYAVGRVVSPALARVDPAVQMARYHYSDRSSATTTPGHIPEAVEAYLASGGSAEALQRRAAVQVQRYRVAGGLLGAFVAMTIGAKVIMGCMQRPRQGYWADPATCLACGRCFVYCPREHLRRGDLAAK